MCIVEIHEIDIIFINWAMTKEPMQMKTKTFVFVVALKIAFFNGSTKGGFKIFMNVSYEENCFLLQVSDFTRPFYRSRP